MIFFFTQYFWAKRGQIRKDEPGKTTVKLRLFSFQCAMLYSTLEKRKDRNQVEERKNGNGS